jgi:hypothetical protein
MPALLLPGAILLHFAHHVDGVLGLAVAVALGPKVGPDWQPVPCVTARASFSASVTGSGVLRTYYQLHRSVLCTRLVHAANHTSHKPLPVGQFPLFGFLGRIRCTRSAALFLHLIVTLAYVVANTGSKGCQ